MEENRRIILTTSPTLDNVMEFNNLGGEYCSFRGFFGSVIKSLENINQDEYITQDMYIDALEKLGLVVRGSYKKSIDEDGNKSRYPVLHIGDSDRLLPPEDYTNQMLEQMYAEEDREPEPANDIYKVKRGTFGFNCGDINLLVERVVTPVVEILTEVNIGITDIYNITNEQESMLKELGLSIVTYRNAKIKTLLGRLLK